MGVSRSLLREKGVSRSLLRDIGVSRSLLRDIGVFKFLLRDIGVSKSLLWDIGYPKWRRLEGGDMEGDIEMLSSKGSCSISSWSRLHQGNSEIRSEKQLEFIRDCGSNSQKQQNYRDYSEI